MRRGCASFWRRGVAKGATLLQYLLVSWERRPRLAGGGSVFMGRAEASGQDGRWLAGRD